MESLGGRAPTLIKFAKDMNFMSIGVKRGISE